jgi:SAM-dependent methyltransferase
MNMGAMVTDKTLFSLRAWLDVLVCPVCRIRPALGADQTYLCCPTCQRQYPLIDGILRCREFHSAQPEDLIKQREVEARDTSAEEYDRGEPTMHNRLEIPPSVQAMQPCSNDVVAELGCGVGRITLYYLSRVQRVVALDFSLQSLLVLRRRLPAELRERILLVHADIARLPLARQTFSKAVSFQVIEHLPTPELRQQIMQDVASILRPEGTFTFSVYHWSLGKKRDSARGIGDHTYKEGYHLSGIYYYNFEEPEVRALLHQAGLGVDLVRGLIIPIRGGSILGPLVVPLNGWLAGTNYGIQRAHLLLARGRAPGSSSK